MTPIHVTVDLIDRFRRRIIDADHCWLWTGAVNKNGYGHLLHQGHQLFAHRVAYTMRYGPIAPGLHVRHSSDCVSRLCCNPDHLRRGTEFENRLDAQFHRYWDNAVFDSDLSDPPVEQTEPTLLPLTTMTPLRPGRPATAMTRARIVSLYTKFVPEHVWLQLNG